MNIKDFDQYYVRESIYGTTGTIMTGLPPEGYIGQPIRIVLITRYAYHYQSTNQNGSSCAYHYKSSNQNGSHKCSFTLTATCRCSNNTCCLFGVYLKNE